MQKIEEKRIHHQYLKDHQDIIMIQINHQCINLLINRRSPRYQPINTGRCIDPVPMINTNDILPPAAAWMNPRKSDVLTPRKNSNGINNIIQFIYLH